MTAVPFDERIRDQSGLRSIYPEPSQGAVDKAIDHIDEAVRDFIARSPLFVLATGDGERNDASPRGGPPGFVRVIDERRLAFGDLVGNNRLDSYQNLLDHPGVGMLFMLPGLLETLRINGRASLSVDEGLRERCAIDGRTPKVIVGVEVEECFIHCGAALRRSNLWDISTWTPDDERPSPGAILKAHAKLDSVSAADIEAGLADYYDTAVWLVGGHAED